MKINSLKELEAEVHKVDPLARIIGTQIQCSFAFNEILLHLHTGSNHISILGTGRVWGLGSTDTEPILDYLIALHNCNGRNEKKIPYQNYLNKGK